MSARLHLQPFKAAPPIPLGLAVTFAAIGFSTGRRAVRPLFAITARVAVSLEVGESRRTQTTVSLTTAGVAIATVPETGRWAGALAHVEVTHRGERTTIVLSDPDTGIPSPCSADRHGEPFELPPACATADFLQRYPTPRRRAPFAVRRQGSP